MNELTLSLSADAVDLARRLCELLAELETEPASDDLHVYLAEPDALGVVRAEARSYSPPLRPQGLAGFMAPVAVATAEVRPLPGGRCRLSLRRCQPVTEPAWARLLAGLAELCPEAAPAAAPRRAGVLPDYMTALPQAYRQLVGELGRRPSQAELASKLLVSEDTVKRRVKDLKAAGLPWPPAPA